MITGMLQPEIFLSAAAAKTVCEVFVCAICCQVTAMEVKFSLSLDMTSLKACTVAAPATAGCWLLLT